MKVKVDARLCERTGFCVQVSDAVFELPEGSGPARVLTDELAPSQEELAIEAMELCPTQAVIVEGNR